MGAISDVNAIKRSLSPARLGRLGFVRLPPSDTTSMNIEVSLLIRLVNRVSIVRWRKCANYAPKVNLLTLSCAIFHLQNPKRFCPSRLWRAEVTRLKVRKFNTHVINGTRDAIMESLKPILHLQSHFFQSNFVTQPALSKSKLPKFLDQSEMHVLNISDKMVISRLLANRIAGLRFECDGDLLGTGRPNLIPSRCCPGPI